MPKDQTQQSRFHKAAELHFAELVAEDAICHPPFEDANGWDFYLEFLQRAFDGPAEEAPGHTCAFVQVKSTIGRSLTCRVKVSNMLKAVQDPRPWFIVLVRRDGPRKEIFIRHFWSDLMAIGLKAARQAGLDGVELQARKLSIAFSEADRVDGVSIATQLRAHIEDVGADYEGQKAGHRKELGFDDGHGVGQLLIGGHTRDEVFRALLGVGNGLTLTRFEYVPTRFGLPDYSRQVRAEGGTVRFTPKSLGPCQLRFKRPNKFASSIELRGDRFGLPFPFKAQYRVSSPPVELMIDGRVVDLTMSLSPHQAMPLEHWYIYSKLKVWAAEGPVGIEVWRDGEKIESNVLIGGDSSGGLDWKVINQAVEAVRDIARSKDVAGLEFSIDDLSSSVGDLGYLFQGRAPSLRYEGDIASELPDRFTSMIYYSTVNLVGWTFGHILKRRVISDIVQDDRRSITSTDATIVETYAFQNASAFQLQAMRDEFEQFHLDLEAVETPLSFGEFGTFLRSLTPPPDAA